MDQPVGSVVMLDGTPPSLLQVPVVNVIVLLVADLLPAASLASTANVYGLLQANPVTVVEVAGGLPVTVLYTEVPLTTSYAVTPTLSVDPVQVRLTLVDCTLDATRLAGAVGAWVSELGSVVQIAWALLSETLPAASRANTDRRYSVLGVRPVRSLVVTVPGASESLLPS